MSNPRRNTRSITQDRGTGLASASAEVNAPSSVQSYQKDTRLVEQALNNLGQQWGQKRAADAAKATESARASGFLDASLGRVDEGRMVAGSAYSEGATASRVETLGLETINRSLVDLERDAMQPDFDYEEWRQARLEEFIDMSAVGQSPAAKERLAGYVSQFNQNTRARFEQLSAKRRLQEGQENLALNFNAFLESGMTTAEQAKQWAATRGAESGLEDDEVRATMGTILLSKLSMGDTNAYTMAEGLGLLANPEMQQRFVQGQQMAEAKIERDRMNALKEDVQGRTQIMSEVAQKVAAGNFSPAEAAVLAQKRPDLQSFFESSVLQAIGQRRAQADQARKEAMETQRLAGLQTALATGNRRALTEGRLVGAWSEREEKQQADQMVRRAWATSLSDDPQERAYGIEQIKYAVSTLSSSGVASGELKRLLTTADPSNPTEFDKVAELYRTLEATPQRDFVRSQMDGSSRALFDRYSELVNSNMTPAQAAAELSSRRVAPEVLDRNFNIVRASRQFDAGLKAALDDMSADGVSPLALEEEFEGLVRAELLYATSHSDAVERAREKLTTAYVTIGGVPMRKGGWVDEAFASNWEAYSEDVLKPFLVQRDGEDAGSAPVSIVPIPNSTEFHLMYTGTTNLVEAQDENGNYRPIIMSAAEVADQAVQAVTRREERRRQFQERVAQGAAGFDAYDPELQKREEQRWKDRADEQRRQWEAHPDGTPPVKLF
jgi:hypothetical protein